MSLLLSNARLLAFNDTTPPGADAVLIEGDRITAVGSTADLRARAGAAELLDLEGALLTPGWTDTHCHFYEWGRKLAGVDLTPAEDLDAVAAMLREHRAKLDDDVVWVGGGGWNPQFIGRPGLDRHFLDEIFPDHPVVFESRDFHTVWVNSRALAEAGILERDVAEIEVPAGGRVGRGADGKPDGLLYETAWDLVWSVRPPEAPAVARRWLDDATRAAHALGLTAVNTMESQSTLEHFRRIASEDGLGLRVCFHTPLDHLDDRIARGEPGYTDLSPWLRLGGVKIFMDGSLGSRSAKMVEPYPDGSHGTQVFAREELTEFLRQAARAGIGGSVHAIGDAVVLEVAEVFAKIREEFGAELFHRMEHAQCVPDAALPLLAENRIYCAMQPVHLLYDGEVLDAEWGAASRNTYRCRDLLAAEVPVGLGSDAPVAPLDPRPGIEVAISRRWDDGEPPHMPAQALTAVEALRGYTQGAAGASCRQDELGRLAPGYLADLTAVDDVLNEDAPAWREARVRLTVSGGKVVHEAL